jgi:hypothetical protein
MYLRSPLRAHTFNCYSKMLDSTCDIASESWKPYFWWRILEASFWTSSGFTKEQKKSNERALTQPRRRFAETFLDIGVARGVDRGQWRAVAESDGLYPFSNQAWRGPPMKKIENGHTFRSWWENDIPSINFGSAPNCRPHPACGPDCGPSCNQNIHSKSTVGSTPKVYRQDVVFLSRSICAPIFNFFYLGSPPQPD